MSDFKINSIPDCKGAHVGTVIQHPKLQATDPAVRQRLSNSFSIKRRATLTNARHLLSCLIRLADSPAYAGIARQLPACQDIIDDLDRLDPTDAAAKRQLAGIVRNLRDITRSVVVHDDGRRHPNTDGPPPVRGIAVGT